MKTTTIKILFVILIILPFISHTQSLTWVGATDNDFYNELNWVVTGSEENPTAGSIDPGVVIAFDLTVVDASFDLTGQTLSFSPTTRGLTLDESTFIIDALVAGKVKLSGRTTLTLNGEEPLGTEALVDFQDMLSWVKLLSADGYVADSVYLSRFTSKDQALVVGQSIRINQYYFNGSLIRLIDSAFEPLTLFDGQGQSGDSFGVTNFAIYKRNELGDFDNRTSSFRLERGYQVNMAIFQNGTGKSQVYIASEEALEIDLPVALDDNVSFVRVTPWNWVTKKGVSNFKSEVGATWSYNWSAANDSKPNIEYAPMSWGGGGASLAAVESYIAKENVTHVMGFNESDNCNDQSGQYGGLCQIEIAVPLFKNLMTSGLRLVSPSPRENGPFTWLKDFRNEAKATDVRYDVLGVHWYDWGANPSETPFEDPEKVFNRFKNYLDRVYAEHQMPIWITEFNANANRDISVHMGFLKLALPYLETLDFVERYDFFSVNPAVAGNREDIEFGVFFDLEDGTLTELGEIYRDHKSTPSVPEATWSTPTYLAGMEERIGLRLEIDQDTLREGEAMFVNIFTDRTVGSPQTFSIKLQNTESDQYTIRDLEITIPEGASTAQTVLMLIDDDAVEDTVKVAFEVEFITNGLELVGSEVALVLLSEDQPVVPPALGINEEVKIAIWPNPATDVLHVESSFGTMKKLKLISMDGRQYQLVKRDNGYDISNINSGLYVLKIQTLDGNTLTKKIVIDE